jgi:hypothetical protein
MKRMSLTRIAVLLAGSIATASAQPQSQEPRDAPPATSPPPSRDAQPAPVAPARGCQTQWGVCQIACCVAPGTPCRCRDANGNVVSGYAVDFYRSTR